MLPRLVLGLRKPRTKVEDSEKRKAHARGNCSLLRLRGRLHVACLEAPALQALLLQVLNAPCRPAFRLLWRTEL